jgi:hypothetical protein
MAIFALRLTVGCLHLARPAAEIGIAAHGDHKSNAGFSGRAFVVNCSYVACLISVADTLLSATPMARELSTLFEAHGDTRPNSGTRR